MSPTPNQVLVTVKELLTQGNVAAVCIIDDEYERVGTFSEVDPQSRLDLYTAIQGSDDALKELSLLEIAIKSEHDITDDILGRLFDGSERATVIAEFMRQHGCTKKRLSEFLEQLEKILLENLALTVWKFAPHDVGEQAGGCQLFFVDYMLDESGIEQSLIVADRLGQRIKELKVQPLVILMSDKPNVNEIAWTAFRDKADLIGGTFHFFPKPLFDNEPLFLFRLADIVDTIDGARRIQQFVRQIDEKSQDVVNRFRQTIKGLTLQDYGFIEKLSLQGEGQALGDYLVWLFGAYFGQMAADATADSKNELDRMHFKRIPDVGSGPSPGFVSLFETVVSERAPSLAKPEPLSPPELHLGDLFISEDLKQVLMVITPECDLRFTEEGLGTRDYDGDQTVLLIPGDATNHELGQSDQGNVSDYVVLKEKRFKISWRGDRVRSLPLKDAAETLHTEKYDRVARLKSPFILSVQGDVVRQLARVGKPVGPLPSLDAEATIWAEEGGKPIKKSTSRVRTYLDRKGDRHALLPVATIEEMLKIGTDCEEGLAGAVRQQGSPAKYGQWLGALRALRANLQLCLSLRGPHKLPKKGISRSFEAKPLCISSSIGDFGDRWTPDGPICLDVNID
jgi:hypothetical protein